MFAEERDWQWIFHTTVWSDSFIYVPTDAEDAHYVKYFDGLSHGDQYLLHEDHDDPGGGGHTFPNIWEYDENNELKILFRVGLLVKDKGDDLSFFNYHGKDIEENDVGDCWYYYAKTKEYYYVEVPLTLVYDPDHYMGNYDYSGEWNVSPPLIPTETDTPIDTPTPEETVTQTPYVKILSADLCKDNLELELGSNSENGDLKVELIGTPNFILPHLNNVNKNPGFVSDNFNIGDFPDNESYTGIIATWRVNGIDYESDPYSLSFKVLRDYLVTCYNTPAEEEDKWMGSDTGVCVTNATGPDRDHCNWETFSYKKDFLDAVVMNGSGIGSDGITISLEYYCRNPSDCPGLYSGVWPGEWAFRKPSSVKGTNACGSVDLQTAVSAAKYKTNEQLNCSDNFCVENISGTRILHDHGGDLDVYQVDLYQGVGSLTCEEWP
ncbi:MAG: hypothetical protein R6U19_09220, partial [Bacteroidales bacterium]